MDKLNFSSIELKNKELTIFQLKRDVIFIRVTNNSMDVSDESGISSKLHEFVRVKSEIEKKYVMLPKRCKSCQLLQLNKGKSSSQRLNKVRLIWRVEMIDCERNIATQVKIAR